MEQSNNSTSFESLGRRRKRLPFENIVKRVKPETRSRYELIVKELRKYDFNDRISIPGETFSYKKKKYIFLTFLGNTLNVHFRLDPKKYSDSTIPVKDVSNIIRYKDLPARLTIKSDLAARRAVLLAKEIVKERKISLK